MSAFMVMVRRVRLAENVFRSLSEQDFVRGVQQAARALILDQYRRLNALRQEVYEPSGGAR